MTQEAPLLSDWCKPYFEGLKQNLNGLSGSDFQQLRESAFKNFLQLGYPQAKQEEDWKYTNIREIAALDFQVAQDRGAEVPTEVIPEIFKEQDSQDVVLVNGSYAREQSLNIKVDGASVCSLRDILHNKDSHCEKIAGLVREKLGSVAGNEVNGCVAMNTSFIEDGVVIHVEKNKVVDQPIRLIFVASGDDKPTVSFPRVFLFAEEGSQIHVMEEYRSTGNAVTFSNALTEVIVGENANVQHTVLSFESEDSFHYGHIAVDQSQNSNFKTSSYCFGGKIVRNEVRPVLNGTGINTEMYGLSVLRGKQHVDNFTVLDHAEPHCESNELYKGIYNDESTGVFCGTIIVREDAQKTNAIQSSQGLLLSDKASLNSKPQLKIWADDVKCTHGATVGQLDEDALFYLRSRGVSKADAMNMLITAFAGDVTKEIELPELRAYVEQQLQSKLSIAA